MIGKDRANRFCSLVGANEPAVLRIWLKIANKIACVGRSFENQHLLSWQSKPNVEFVTVTGPRNCHAVGRQTRLQVRGYGDNRVFWAVFGLSFASSSVCWAIRGYDDPIVFAPLIDDVYACFDRLVAMDTRQADGYLALISDLFRSGSEPTASGLDFFIGDRAKHIVGNW